MARVLQAEGVRKAYKEKTLINPDLVAVDGETNPKRRKKDHGDDSKPLEIKVRMPKSVQWPRNVLIWTYGSMEKALHILVGGCDASWMEISNY